MNVGEARNASRIASVTSAGVCAWGQGVEPHEARDLGVGQGTAVRLAAERLDRVGETGRLSRVAGDELGLVGGVAHDLGGNLLGCGQVPVPGDIGEAAGGVVGDEVHDVGPGRDADQLIDHGRVLGPCQPRNLTRYRDSGRARRYHQPTTGAARPDRAGRSRARGSGSAGDRHPRCRCSRPGRPTARPKDSCEWSASFASHPALLLEAQRSGRVRAAHNGNLRSESATLCPTDATLLRYRLTLFQIIFCRRRDPREREWECPRRWQTTPSARLLATNAG